MGDAVEDLEEEMRRIEDLYKLTTASKRLVKKGVYVKPKYRFKKGTHVKVVYRKTIYVGTFSKVLSFNDKIDDGYDTSKVWYLIKFADTCGVYSERHIQPFAKLSEQT